MVVELLVHCAVLKSRVGTDVPWNLETFRNNQTYKKQITK